MADDLLPIRVVFPGADDYRKPDRTSRPWDPLVDVTPTLRQGLFDQMEVVRDAFRPSFERWSDVPAVARVQLRPEAQAKSYRPSEIFNETTCPIIGTSGAGQLLVAVNSSGMDRVERQLFNEAQRATAHVSAIAQIVPYKAPVLDLPDKGDVARTKLRVKLFRHPSRAVNEAIDRTFEAIIKDSNRAAHGTASLSAVHYADGIRIYRVQGLASDAVLRLSSFVGVQSVSQFPSYRVVRAASHILRPISDDVFPAPAIDREYPAVGIIDSGTDPKNQRLQSWVIRRHDKWIPQLMQNNGHGSFVAGLIANSRVLNHQDPRFPSASAKIVDVIAFDKDGEQTEDDLLQIIDDALVTFPEVRVWNLSLSLVGSACDDVEMSDIAAALDERAAEKNVLFVLAAGNYQEPPFRSWPPQLSIDDRIRPPADSVRGLTVGGLAHLDTATTVVKREEPSPFSRRGLAPGGRIKPDIAHYAGNIDHNGRYLQTGLISIDGSGNIAEDVGTSFACPLVSVIAANVHDELSVQGQGAENTLVKALMMHSAFLKGGVLSAHDLPYVGAGLPGDVDEILNCRQSAATMIVQATVRPGVLFEKRPFPMPRCLIDEDSGKLRAEVFMTLLYDCPLDRQFGLEYCRTNVTASLGTMEVDEETGEEVYKRQVNPVPEGVDALLSPEVLEHGHRWSPAKYYFRRFKRGPDREWRLTLSALDRAEHVSTPQDVVLIVTIRALNESSLVYDELVREMNRLAWNNGDLPVQSRARERNR